MSDQTNQNTTEEQPKPRNLRKNEVKVIIKGFTKILENIYINDKPIIVSATVNSITMNPEVPMEEIQQVFQIREKTKLDFIRQLYIRSGTKLIKELFPNDNILNIPMVSFEENGQAIMMRY